MTYASPHQRRGTTSRGWLRQQVRYTPGQWLPHVTVLQSIPAHRIGEASQAVLAALPPLPLVATVESVGCISFRPGCDVLSFELGSGADLMQGAAPSAGRATLPATMLARRSHTPQRAREACHADSRDESLAS